MGLIQKKEEHDSPDAASIYKSSLFVNGSLIRITQLLCFPIVNIRSAFGCLLASSWIKMYL